MKFSTCVPLALLASTALVAVSDSLPSVAAVRKVPLRVVNSDTIDLGEIPTYGMTNRTFRLQNHGDTTVTVQRVVSTCGCIQGRVSTNAIVPAGEVEVTLTLDATKVHGPFKRGIWLHFADPSQRPVGLAFTGVAAPIFSGFPDALVELASRGTGVVLTNTFTLKSLKANVTLGEPRVECPEGIAFDYTLVTNATGEQATYTLITRVTPQAKRMRHTARLTLPIQGTPEPAMPLMLRLRVREHGTLYAVPNKIGLDPENTGTQHFRLIIRSRKVSLDSEAQLTWDPLPEGVKLSTRSIGRRKRSLSVMVQVTPEAAARFLQRDDEPQELHFHYPDQPSVTVTFVQADPAHPQRSPRSLTRRLNLQEE